jgi:hypothetical protein
MLGLCSLALNLEFLQHITTFESLQNIVISKSPGHLKTRVFITIAVKTKVYGDDAQAESTSIKLSRAKKTCKPLWIDIQDGLMGNWLKVLAKTLTQLSTILKSLNRKVVDTNTH